MQDWLEKKNIKPVVYAVHGFLYFKGAPLVNRTVYKVGGIHSCPLNGLSDHNYRKLISKKKYYMNVGRPGGRLSGKTES